MLQFLDTGTGAATAAKREVETFIAGAAITALDWVMIDTSKTDSDRAIYAIQADTSFSLGNPLVVGVALDSAAAAGDKVRVVVAGYVEGAAVANAVNAAGIALVVDNTTAGRAVALAATDTCQPCGVSLEAASGNKADVLVFGLRR